jgi:hypothetical protein
LYYTFLASTKTAMYDGPFLVLELPCGGVVELAKPICSILRTQFLDVLALPLSKRTMPPVTRVIAIGTRGSIEKMLVT